IIVVWAATGAARTVHRIRGTDRIAVAARDGLLQVMDAGGVYPRPRPAGVAEARALAARWHEATGPGSPGGPPPIPRATPPVITERSARRSARDQRGIRRSTTPCCARSRRWWCRRR